MRLERGPPFGPGASKGTPGDAKCVTKILGGTKNYEVRGDKVDLFVLREN